MEQTPQPSTGPQGLVINMEYKWELKDEESSGFATYYAICQNVIYSRRGERRDLDRELIPVNQMSG